MFGAEVEYNGNFTASVGVQTKLEDVQLKGKVSSDHNLSLSAKRKCSKYEHDMYIYRLTYTVAVQIPLSEKPTSCGPFPFPVGLTLELNP
jgi:hypothetical protein